MSNRTSTRTVSAITRTYADRTPSSKRAWEQFGRNMPDGNTRHSAFFRPYPVVIERGDGATLVDADGNRYYDMLNNYTSLVHGNAHPELMAAARSVMENGTAFPSPHRLQAQHAAVICERIDGAEMVRYTNSGTEAAMMAIRLARAATGRETIAKARGGYHGSWDGLSPGSHDDELKPESRGAPDPGVPRAVHELVRLFELNDAEDLTRVCEASASDLAAIIVEPMLGSGGAVPATPEFLATARELADRTGAVLILDEVQTFRLAPGGLQQHLGCRGDLTILGKLIGGGFPIGAIAGSRELLNLFRLDSARHVTHSGTFNGNLVAMAAGLRSMELLTPEAIARINSDGVRFANVLGQAIEASGLGGCVTGYGSMFNAHLGADVKDVQCGSDALRSDPALMDLLHLSLMNEGVFSAPRGFLNCSTALGEDDISAIERAIGAAVAAVAADS